MSRSVAFSLERSAIFSARSRSLWKLLWIFLISSLLEENWAWMSAGRYSYRQHRHGIVITGNAGSAAWKCIMTVTSLERDTEWSKPLLESQVCRLKTHPPFSWTHHAVWFGHPTRTKKKKTTVRHTSYSLPWISLLRHHSNNVKPTFTHYISCCDTFFRICKIVALKRWVHDL